jgi:hypothetical protein
MASIPYEELKGLCFNLREFISAAEAMRDEFDAEDGRLTCEFSTSGDMLADKIQLLAKMPCKRGFWRVIWCEICHSRCPESPFHCELISKNSH